MRVDAFVFNESASHYVSGSLFVDEDFNSIPKACHSIREVANGQDHPQCLLVRMELEGRLFHASTLRIGSLRSNPHAWGAPMPNHGRHGGRRNCQANITLCQRCSPKGVRTD